MKNKFTISLDEETTDKLKLFVAANHTSISQFITDRIWEYDRSCKKEDISDMFLVKEGSKEETGEA